MWEMAGCKSRRDGGMGDWGMEKKSYGIIELKENTAVSGDKDRGQCIKGFDGKNGQRHKYACKCV